LRAARVVAVSQVSFTGHSVCDALAVTKGRLEAFTDAVIAIVMTIMVLDLRRPEARTAKTFGLRLELHVPGDLLEQPPPSDARR
jgi:hypothetical protein